jgi:hypothetical protein
MDANCSAFCGLTSFDSSSTAGTIKIATNPGTASAVATPAYLTVCGITSSNTSGNAHGVDVASGFTALAMLDCQVKIDAPSGTGTRFLKDSVPVSDSGAATSATTLTITDATKNWTANAFSGSAVRITAGTGANQTRLITGNTNQTLTINAAWAPNPAAGSTYQIVPAVLLGQGGNVFLPDSTGITTNATVSAGIVIQTLTTAPTSAV